MQTCSDKNRTGHASNSLMNLKPNSKSSRRSEHSHASIRFDTIVGRMLGVLLVMRAMLCRAQIHVPFAQMRAAHFLHYSEYSNNKFERKKITPVSMRSGVMRFDNRQRFVNAVVERSN